MTRYAGALVCRRKQLLAYFGEQYEPEDCGACDACCGEVERVDATRDARIVMSAVFRTGERFGAGHVVDVVAGAKTQRILELRHDRVKTYGVGSDRPKKHWRGVVDHLLGQGCLTRTEGRYGSLRITGAGWRVLLGKKDFVVPRPKPRRRTRQAVPDEQFSEELFEILRELRKDRAREANVPPYVIFSDKTLRQMARDYPTTDEEMLTVSGVGEVKLRRYGGQFLAAIRGFSPG